MKVASQASEIWVALFLNSTDHRFMKVYVGEPSVASSNRMNVDFQNQELQDGCLLALLLPPRSAESHEPEQYDFCTGAWTPQSLQLDFDILSSNLEIDGIDGLGAVINIHSVDLLFYTSLLLHFHRKRHLTFSCVALFPLSEICRLGSYEDCAAILSFRIFLKSPTDRYSVVISLPVLFMSTPYSQGCLRCSFPPFTKVLRRHS